MGIAETLLLQRTAERVAELEERVQMLEQHVRALTERPNKTLHLKPDPHGKD